jgi:hypothetical protein
MYKISIPKPCFESWENMTPDGTGRYCLSCQKTVVDFTTWGDDAVKRYFLQYQNNAVCGRFKKVQLDRIIITLPKNIFNLKIAIWKKYLVILLLCFGSNFLGIDAGFGNNLAFTQGEPVLQQIPTSVKVTSLNSKKHWKKKKKKINRTHNWVLCVNDFEIISGFIQTKPSTPEYINKELLNPDSDETAINTDSQVYKITAGQGNKNQRSAKQPKPLQTPFSTAFILAERISIKRRSLFSKK